ncbi:meiotically up-regulated gene 113-domain-containing protein [Dissophora ornata]|nr:meiotically up-regulated gene 113-domain-containing protein [Dissophora ornata]
MADNNSTRCKAIAISTGQRCTRSGKLDGYCSEKHKQQADPKTGLWGMNRTNLFSDSEGDAQSVPAAAPKKLIKTNKAEKTTGIKKTADAQDTAVPAPAPAVKPKATKASKETKATKAPATRKKPAAKTTRAKKQVDIESSDEFQPESDDDYEPSDSHVENDDNDSDFDDSEVSDEDLDELSGKLASVKIKSDDPTLPPKAGSGSSPVNTKLKRTKSKIINSNAVLAPPKNKTKSSSATGRPTGGFWIAAPPQVKIPESTIKVLSDILNRRDSDSSDLVPADHQKKPSGLFKYRARVHNYLFATEEDLNPNSTRAGVKKMFNEVRSLFHKIKYSDLETAPASEKPLPGIPSGTEHRPSVDSSTIASEASTLTPKVDDDEVPNQCHGYNTNGHRCKRRVKLDRPIELGEVLMCHDHEVSDEDEVVVHIEGKGGVMLQWLDLSSWVNPNLPDYVQNKLRKAIERPVSETDKPGYIYGYQLVETRITDTHTLFKVGRTDNVYRRMNEWSDKCGSPPLLIEVFPEQGSLAPKDEKDLAETATKIADDNEVTGLRCRYSHRVERLIHIELKPFHDKDHVCACKTNHREWFKVPHQPGLTDSQQMKQAWGQIRRVIVHWMAYMEHVYGPG